MNDELSYVEYTGYRCLHADYHQNPDLHLTRCGMSQCAPHEFWGPRSRPEFTICILYYPVLAVWKLKRKNIS